MAVELRGSEIDLPASEHSRQTIDRALIQLVYANGNCAEAARQLKDQHNITLHRSTIWDWRSKYRDRYLQIREKIEPEVRSLLAAEHEDAALLAVQKAKDGLASVDIPELKAVDRSTAVRNIAVSAGVFADKAAALRGRPTEIVENRHAIEIVHKLRTVSPSLVVDGTVEEDEDAA